MTFDIIERCAGRACFKDEILRKGQGTTGNGAVRCVASLHTLDQGRCNKTEKIDAHKGSKAVRMAS